MLNTQGTSVRHRLLHVEEEDDVHPAGGGVGVSRHTPRSGSVRKGLRKIRDWTDSSGTRICRRMYRFACKNWYALFNASVAGTILFLALWVFLQLSAPMNFSKEESKIILDKNKSSPYTHMRYEDIYTIDVGSDIGGIRQVRFEGVRDITEKSKRPCSEISTLEITEGKVIIPHAQKFDSTVEYAHVAIALADILGANEVVLDALFATHEEKHGAREDDGEEVQRPTPLFSTAPKFWNLPASTNPDMTYLESLNPCVLSVRMRSGAFLHMIDPEIVTDAPKTNGPGTKISASMSPEAGDPFGFWHPSSMVMYRSVPISYIDSVTADSVYDHVDYDVEYSLTLQLYIFMLAEEEFSKVLLRDN